MQNKDNMLDIMSVISFIIGVANYNENISQSDLQEIMKDALKDIHGHLLQQDEKINEILELLKGEQNNE